MSFFPSLFKRGRFYFFFVRFCLLFELFLSRYIILNFNFDIFIEVYESVLNLYYMPNLIHTIHNCQQVIRFSETFQLMKNIGTYAFKLLIICDFMLTNLIAILVCHACNHFLNLSFDIINDCLAWYFICFLFFLLNLTFILHFSIIF